MAISLHTDVLINDSHSKHGLFDIALGGTTQHISRQARLMGSDLEQCGHLTGETGEQRRGQRICGVQRGYQAQGELLAPIDRLAGLCAASILQLFAVRHRRPRRSEAWL